MHIIDNFLSHNCIQVHQDFIKDEMKNFKNNLRNNNYWVNDPFDVDTTHLHPEGFSAFKYAFSKLRFDALINVKHYWFIKSRKINEFPVESTIVNDIDNLIYFTDDNNGYVKIDDTTIDNIPNRLVIYRGNPKNITHSSMTSEDNFRSVTHIQCLLKTIPEGEPLLKY